MIFIRNNQPFVRLKVKFPKNDWRIFEFLVDTGFTAGITLPHKYSEYFPKDKFVRAKFILAAGSEFITDSIPTEVRYGKITKEVLIVFIGDSMNLAGVEFLNQLNFCLDLKNRKATLTE